MKTKNKLKILLFIGLIFITILMLNNTVNAEVSQEYLQNMLDVLPESMDINLKESEYEKASAEVEKQVKAIWQEKEIDTTGIDIRIYTNPIYFWLVNDNFHKANVYLRLKENGKDIELHKEITIKYNNTKDYNLADEQVVKNLKLESPVYFEFSLEEAIANKQYDSWTELFKLAEKYYNNLVKDKSITIRADSGAGDWLGFGCEDGEGGTGIAIFKNDVFYASRVMGSEVSIPVITVPNSISENEQNDYIITMLRDFMKAHPEHIGWWTNEGEEVVDIDYFKIEEIDKPNNGEFVDEGYVIVRKEQPIQSPVTDTDTDTNIQLEANTDVVPSDTVLEIKPIEKNNVTVLEDTVNNFVAYDITLKSNGVEVQPNGKVKIKIPVPAEFDTSKLVVYRIDGNNKIKYDVTVETIDGKKYAVFETDHFSTYVLAETNRQLDDEPKTGVNNHVIAILLTSSILFTSLVLIKRRCN